MARPRTPHSCTSCGASHPSWSGRCHTCGEWGSVEPDVVSPSAGAGRARPAQPGPQPIDAGTGEPATGHPTGIAAFDDLLGGGLVPGSVTLVGGEPGIGKSTLLLQVLASVAESGRPALLATAEESVDQVRARAARLGALRPRLSIIATTHLDEIISAVAATSPAVVVVDSVQTVGTPDASGVPGSVTQVREVAHRLVEVAKCDGPAIVLVGHVTKDGALAGPRVLEHLVDTVLSFDGDRHHALRLLRGVKHRFGATGDAAVFEMTADGLAAVLDPSALLLADRRAGVPGSVVVPALVEGRAVVTEVQALVAREASLQPRRTVTGLDAGRVGLTVAVLDRWAGHRIGASECWVSAAGGLRVTEPAADLGVAVALASSIVGEAVPDDLVLCAEVGLGGELRQVGHMARRLAEAARAGFRRAIVPPTAPFGPDGMELIRLDSVCDALTLAGVGVRRGELAGGSDPASW